MKKSIIAAVLILFSVLLSVSAYAVSKTYTLDKLYMKIDVPGDWMTFTQNVDANDPNLTILGTDAATLIDYYKDNDIYLNSVCSDPMCEIVVTMIESSDIKDVFNFNNFSDDELNKEAEEYMVSDEAKKIGANYTGCSIYSHNKTKYSVLDFWQDDGNGKTYARQYYTIYNGQAINITLHSYDGEITEAMALKHKEIVDSVVFTQTLVNPGESGTITGSGLLDKVLIGFITAAIAGFIIRLIQSRKKKKEANNTESYPN